MKTSPQCAKVVKSDCMKEHDNNMERIKAGLH